MKRRTKIVSGIVGLVALGGVAAVAAPRGGSDDDAPPTVTVDRGEIVARALAVGTIEPEVEVEVKSKVSGVVRRRFADVGDFVHAGDPLLDIKPDPTPLELVEARRQVELRQIDADNLSKDLERKRELQKRGLLSDQEFDAAQRDYREAALQVETARERLALLEEGKVKSGGKSVESVVRSPIDGFILEKMVEIGDPVVPLSTYQEGTVLLTMADMGRLIFRGTVDEIDVGRLREGMPASIKVGALPDAKIEGVLSKISLKAQEKENSRVFPVEVTLGDRGDITLRAGYSANAEIVIEKRDSVLTIPERVVHFDPDSTWVQVYRGPEDIVGRRIETGLSDAIRVEVTKGLEEGERVKEKDVKEIH